MKLRKVKKKKNTQKTNFLLHFKARKEMTEFHYMIEIMTLYAFPVYGTVYLELGVCSSPFTFHRLLTNNKDKTSGEFFLK